MSKVYLELNRVLGADAKFLFQYGLPKIESRVQSVADLLNSKLLIEGLELAKSNLRKPYTEYKLISESQEEKEGGWRYHRDNEVGGRIHESGGGYDPPIYEPGQSARDAEYEEIEVDPDSYERNRIDRAIAVLEKADFSQYASQQSCQKVLDCE